MYKSGNQAEVRPLLLIYLVIHFWTFAAYLCSLVLGEFEGTSGQRRCAFTKGHDHDSVN